MKFKKIFASKPRWTENTGSAKTAEQRDEPERERWSSKLDFFLSTVGYAVGLGNVWRFPYRAYQNGGASFLIPYTATLVLAGLPLFFLEMAFGQFASLGPISVWKVIPIFKGVGWSMVITSFLCSIYYNMIIAYTLYYLFTSFTTQLPWQRCKPDWIEYGCFDHENYTRSNGTTNNLTRRLPAAFYWEREVLDMSSGIDQGAADVKWYLVLCLLLAWIIVCACLIKGIKSSGKVVYFTALFPYVVLVILLIWNVQLDGAGDGIKFYLIPEWRKLARAEVWYSAGTQIFFSLGCGFGTLETMASYNKFKNNVYRDSILVAFINCATSIFAGFVIFSAIGFMAKQTGLPVDKVADGGPGLAFIAYPQGIAMMPVAPLWSCLFFAMLFTLGIDSQFASVETICTALIDEFPSLKVGRRKSIFGLVICAVMFLLGLPQCTRAGIYVMTLFDWYSAGLNLIIISFIETMSISWIYGVKRFSEDIEMMIGHKPNCYWIACWTVLSPIMLMFIFSFTIYGAESAYLGTYVYPRWADGLGWMMVAVSLSTVPAVAAYRCFRVATTQKDWKTLVRPASDWGPAQKEFRTGRYAPGPPPAYPDICAVYRNSHYTLEYLDSNDSSYGHTNIDTKF